MASATITWGTWSDRGADRSETVTLPYVLSPAAAGLPDGDGEYYVVSVAFPAAPDATSTVTAKVVK